MKLPSETDGTTATKAVGIGSIHSIPIAAIDASDRLRPVDQAKAQLIADGIRSWRATGKRGIPAPITVRPSGNGRWKLVAGAHRLSAVILIGDEMIDVIIHDLNDLQARLAEIDENLCRNELNALDRAAFLAERDRIWREMHPEKAGRKGGMKARWHSTDTTEKFSFVSEAAEKVGLSERAIRGDIKLFRLLATTPDAIDRVRGTWLENNQSQLKALAKVPSYDRGDVLDLLLREDAPAKNVAAALAQVNGKTVQEASPDEKAFAALVTQWTRASARMRGRFLDHLDQTGALDAYISGNED